MKKAIPKSVINEAKELIAQYGENIKYRGKYKKYDVYKFVFPDDTETGFPFIYLYSSTTNKAFEITGFDALDILSETKQDVDEQKN
jgi:hypothetical protein